MDVGCGVYDNMKILAHNKNVLRAAYNWFKGLLLLKYIYRTIITCSEGAVFEDIFKFKTFFKRHF